MTNYAACVGIDWADKKHDVSIDITGSGGREIDSLEHDAGSIRNFFNNLHKRVGGQIAVSVETKRGPLCSVLYELENVTLYAVNPVTISKFRRAFTPSGAKDDPTDADFICDVLCLHRNKLQECLPPDEQERRLDLLTRHRRQFVDSYTGLSNQLRDVLKNYYPVFLKLFEDLTTGVALQFLERWSNLENLQEATDEEVLSFLRSHNSTNRSRNARRIELIRQALPLVSSPAQNDVGEQVAVLYCAQLRAVRKAISTLDKDIKAALPQHPDYEILSSFPATGTIHKARLVAAVSANSKQCNSAQALSNYLGISPIVIRSGNTNVIKARKARPVFYHQSVLEWAASTRLYCAWARKSYEAQRARGKSHFVAVRALAFKWLRIMYACLKNRTPYSDSFYNKKLIKA